MQDYEKLGVFYLGRDYDLDRRRPRDELLLYDTKDLCTHAVCVGMTGSGKTGLCLALLEEAAIDGIPAICIDPKGDLGNLMLTFPDLKPADFRPWIDPAEATRRGLQPEEFAAEIAKTWRDGLADWGQPPERIARFRDAVDVAIYTPGSQAGLPLTVMRSFSAPPEGQRQDTEAMRERVTAAASGLLALLGMDADPLKSREHILLSNLLDRTWRDGKNLDLGALIRGIQSPPFDRLGVLDLESFFPAQERFGFAMQLNSLLASPNFAAWREGEPLDVQRLLFTPEGKPRLSILSIAHLSDAERMFFVTILLNEVLAWVRRQPGTSSLRAILYMDEVYGFFPPVANPPCKTPMLTLLKQARAFGVGVVLATQNPVDLDYKGLSNCGTWFLGRLQTERDKARVLDGLEGASAAAGSQFDRGQLERVLSGLGNRVFLMNNVYDDAPVVFQSRWALSYLRGPLTRDQIQTLMAPRKAQTGSTGTSSTAVPLNSEESSHPMLSPDVPEIFLSRRAALFGNDHLQYRPGLYGAARVHFENKAAGVDESRDVWLVIAHVESISPTMWDAATDTDEAPEQQPQPDGDAKFAPLPSALAKPKTYSELSAALKDHLYRTQRLSIHKCKALKESSRSGESEGDFRVRITQAVKEQRDLQVEKLRAKYAPKLAALHEQIRKAEQRVSKEKQQASTQTMNAAVQMGASILGAMFGRKLASATNISRAATSVRSAGRVVSEREDVGRAVETVESLKQRLQDLNAEFESEAAKIRGDMPSDDELFEEVQVRPKKADITATQVALAWTPWVVSPGGTSKPGWE